MATADEQDREREGEERGRGNTRRPTESELVAYGFTSVVICRKSAVQRLLTTWTRMIRSPKLSSSEFSSVTASRSKPHWSRAPAANRAGTVTTRVRIGSMCHDEAIWNVR